MLYKTLKRQIAKYGLTEELKEKIDMFYLAGRLTEAEYKELMGIVDEEEVSEEVPDESVIE